MTATMVARIVERGALNWDRPLAAMLPQFAATMHESYRDVTLVELMSHRAGLPANPSDAREMFATFHTDASPPTPQRLHYVERALREPPAVPKRETFSYANTGFIVAAACAEHATGRSFEALMTSELFQPLQIASASFHPYGAPNQPAGHGEGRVAENWRDTNPRMFAPAGGISMSLPDWSRFCIDQLSGDHGRGRLLRQKTYRLLHSPQGNTDFAALGWGYFANVGGRRGPGLFHAGSNGAWTALVMLFTETGNGALVVSNAYEDMGGDRAANTALRAIVPLITEALP
jgi:CubicO group peptidase (beta-lactamase class C family)